MNDFPIPIIGVMSFFIPYELHWHSSIEEMLKSTYLPAVNIILTLDNVHNENALGIQAKRQDAKLHSCFLCMSGHWTSLQINARMRSMGATDSRKPYALKDTFYEVQLLMIK